MTVEDMWERVIDAERRAAAAEAKLELFETQLAARRRSDRVRQENHRNGQPVTECHVTSRDVTTGSVTPSPSLDPHTPINTSSPRSLSVDQSAGGSLSDAQHDEQPTAPPDPLEALVERVTLALPESRRLLWLAFLRDLPPARRAAWGGNLGEMLDGETPNLRPTPRQLGVALGELMANGDGDNSRLFKGYVRRAIRGELRDAEDASRRDDRGRLRSEGQASADKRSQADLDAYDSARRQAATAWMDAHPTETAAIEAEITASMTTPPDAFGYLLERKMRVVAAVERVLDFPTFDDWSAAP